jgi:hypothetical protein
MDRKVDVIKVNKPITVASLQGQLSRVFGMGTLDGGFPIVTRQESGGVRGWKMMGYISHNELEHGLGQWFLLSFGSSLLIAYYAIQILSKTNQMPPSNSMLVVHREAMLL